MFLNHLFPEQLQGLAHILRKEGTFSSVSVTIFYHMYLQQYGKYLEADLIGSKATNRKQEKFSSFGQGLNPGPFSLESSALPSEPSRLIRLLDCSEEVALVKRLILSDDLYFDIDQASEMTCHSPEFSQRSSISTSCGNRASSQSK